MPESEPAYDAVIVHYDNPLVMEVLQTLAEQTRLPRRVLLVDNSDSLDMALLPEVPFPLDVIGSVGEGGYAAAVNAARSRFAADVLGLLVLTHEVLLAADCSTILLDVLQQDAVVGSAGPVLRRRSSSDEVFSAGGTLDRFAWPRHRAAAVEAVDEVAWIDGSVMMLRREALDAADWLDEDYFLYYEEIDLSARLRTAGWTVVVARDAAAWQEPGGYPPFLALRNRILLVRAFPALLRVPFPLLIGRLAAEVAWVARRRGWSSVLPSARGVLAGLRGRRGRPSR